MVTERLIQMTSLTASAKRGICLVRLRSNVNIAPVQCRPVPVSVVFPEAPGSSGSKKGEFVTNVTNVAQRCV